MKITLIPVLMLLLDACVGILCKTLGMCVRKAKEGIKSIVPTSWSTERPTTTTTIEQIVEKRQIIKAMQNKVTSDRVNFCQNLLAGRLTDWLTDWLNGWMEGWMDFCFVRLNTWDSWLNEVWMVKFAFGQCIMPGIFMYNHNTCGIISVRMDGLFLRIHVESWLVRIFLVKLID